MKVKNIFFGTFISLLLNACCKDNIENANQIGHWNVTTTEATFINGTQTNQYNFDFQLTLNADNTGAQTGLGIPFTVNWYLDKKNNKVFVSVLFMASGRKSYNNILFDIKADETNKQVWEQEQIFVAFPANDTQRTVKNWSLQKQ